MYYVVLAEVVERYEYLDSESLYQVKRETLEMIHLDELVQIHREHFEGDHEMLSEKKLVRPPDDIFLIFGITFVQMLYQSRFHQTLLVQPLLVL